MSYRLHQHVHPKPHLPFELKPQPDAVRKLACQLWEQAGRPEGQSVRFWKQAEGTINAGAPQH